MKILLSIVSYNDSKFEVIIKDKETGEELTFSGSKVMDDEQHELANKIAPACVWTTYERITPED